MCVLQYRIPTNKHTCGQQVGKKFTRRGIGNLLFGRTPWLLHAWTILAWTCSFVLCYAREIHNLDPQPHRYCMLASTASTASAPRVMRRSLGLYWSRDLCSKHAAERLAGWLAGWGMSSYLGHIVRGSEIWWCMPSAHSLSSTLRLRQAWLDAWGTGRLVLRLLRYDQYMAYISEIRSMYGLWRSHLKK